MKFKSYLLGAASAALALAAAPAFAQDAGEEGGEPIATSADIVVIGEIGYRNRSEETAPVLDYGLDYFQRFEPLTAGDMLKRVPSVSFLSDVLEYDGPRLRGLDPGYTQILINGEQVTGAGADRSFFVDRIPAELIERVEIVRSASANRSGDALAGALNIVLRDSYSLEGGFVRLGVLGFNDGRLRETYGGAWGGEVGPGRLLIGGNVQGRRNPKEKLSLRFDSPGGPFQNREIQTDIRNGTDYSFNASYEIDDILGGEFSIQGFFVHTDRVEDEDSIEYRTISGLTQTDIQTLNWQVQNILQDNWSLNSEYEVDMLGGETEIKLGYAYFEEGRTDVETETEYLRDALPFPELDRTTIDTVLTDILDRAIKAKIEHEREFGDVEVEFGVHYQDQAREVELRDRRQRFNAFALVPNTAFVFSDVKIEETRIDPFVQLSGEVGRFSWEAGVRYENTDTDIALVGAAPVNNDFGIVLPSAHLRFELSEQDRFSFSVARTVRRPNFDVILPLTLEEELGDNDFLGNPDLEPETAWGIDVGYERRLGRQGVAGVNVFYRDVTDLIEVFNTGTVGSAGAGTFVLSSRNTGDGQVYGIEFDLSTPLTVVGLENTGVFFNYSWLDSVINDEFGERRFNDQSDFVLNTGFIHEMPALSAAFGATYRLQGDAFGRIVGEEVTTEYGADLEVFVERTFGESFVLRLTGTNLLNASKDEVFNKFVTIGDQRTRAFDEYELETEEAGPAWQLIGRFAF